MPIHIIPVYLYIKTISSMKKILFILTGMLTGFSSYAWGPNGHRAVGQIAEAHLNKKAKSKISALLNSQSIAIAATWMDDIRSDSAYDYAVDWHWVTIPKGKTYDQTEKNPKGDVIEAIERITKALKSKTLSPKQETEYLKMLIHLIGDIHQPLHVGQENDRGGNNVEVKWFGEKSNLHRVWDSDMIDGVKLSYTELAASLDKPTAVQVTTWQNSTVRDWANESQNYLPVVYSQDGNLGYKYSYKNFPIVRTRLLQAGIRLAGVLNEIYGK